MKKMKLKWVLTAVSGLFFLPVFVYGFIKDPLKTTSVVGIITGGAALALWMSDSLD